MYAFGYGEYGQLGLNDEEDACVPVEIPTLTPEMKVIQVAAGDCHSVVLTEDGRVFTFGSGEYGQLGHGNHDDVHVVHQPDDVEGREVGLGAIEVRPRERP